MIPERILFVCTGNSCRSVMAQGLMQQALKQAGVENIRVESAGVFAINGMPASRETQKLLQEIGADFSFHHSRMLTPEMVREADLILAMEQFQMEEILRRVPEVLGKVHLLGTYGLPEMKHSLNPNIPDPIGKPLEVYEVCFAEIRQAVSQVIRSLGIQAVKEEKDDPRGKDSQSST